MNPQESNQFSLLLDRLSLYYGNGSSLKEAKACFKGEAAPLSFSACFEFSQPKGGIIKVHLEEGNKSSWEPLSLLITFGSNNEESFWVEHAEFLEALLLCRIFPKSIIPVAPVLLSHDEIQWQALLPLDEATEAAIINLITAAHAFYEGTTEFIRDFGFCNKLPTTIKTFAYSCDIAWTLREWERQKLQHPHASHVVEKYTQEGYYYRLLPPTEGNPGIAAINLGNKSEFVGIESIWATLLKANAITFLNDSYYVGRDDLEGLLLMAFLPPAREEETASLMQSLLERAVLIRKFITSVTNDLETARIQEKLKNKKEVEEIVFL